MAILKYNETHLLAAKDETEIMTILSDFLARVGQKPHQNDKNIRGPDDSPQKVNQKSRKYLKIVVVVVIIIVIYYYYHYRLLQSL